MNLPKNIVRVNGYTDGKKAHIDFEVPLIPLGAVGYEKELVPCFKNDELVQKAFKAGLTDVASLNSYNWRADDRLTEKLW